MKKRLNLEIEAKTKKSLPSIKKSQSIYASPVHVTKPHGSPNLLSPDRIESKDKAQDRPEDLFIKRLEETTRKTIKHNSMSTPALPVQKKLEPPVHYDLSKRSTDEEIKVKSENFDFLTETISSYNKKTEIDVKRDLGKRNKTKDFEIFASKQKNHELLSYADSLLAEINNLKQSNKLLNDNSAKLSQNLRDCETALAAANELQKLTESKLFQCQTEVAFKQAELEEMKDMIKKTEDKRKVANEQMTNVESKLTTFQKQIVRYHKTNIELQKDLKESNDALKFKDDLIERLYNQISQLDETIEQLKNDAARFQLDFEKTKGVMQEEIDELNHKIEHLENQKKNFEENVLEMQETIKKTKPSITIIKRSESMIDGKYLNGISQEEASRWHARYFNLEQELSLCREQMEKLQKNESYYKGQIEQKNQIIDKMEFIIKNHEKIPSLDLSPPSPVSFNPDALFRMEVLIGRVKTLEEHFKCGNCFKFSRNNQICVPCAHLRCEVCKEECVYKCGTCAGKIETAISFENLSRLAEFYSSHLEELGKLKDALRAPSF